MPHTRRIDGYAIVSEDGMLADASGIMPDSLKFDADRHFFERALDEVDVVVHGRHSHEQQPHSPLRRRLILTRRISGTEVDPVNGLALRWNPADVSFEEALAAVGTPNDRIGIVGGPEVFGMFLDRYDFFHLSRAPNVILPGGRPVFSEVPGRSPEEVLSGAGLAAGRPMWLDQGKGLAVVSWRRRAANRA
jgi:hypothetical protein